MIDKKCKIYQDPYTRLDYEGEAIIREVIKDDDVQVYCSVEFINEPGSYYYRWIDRNDIKI